MGNGAQTSQVRVILAALATTAVVVSLTAVVVLAQPATATDAQAEPGVRPTFVGRATPIPLDTSFSLGTIWVEAPTSSAIRLTGVRIHATDNVRFLGAVAVWGTDQPATGGVVGYPPPDLTDGGMQPIDGDGGRHVEVPSGERVEVVVGVALTGGDLGGVNGIWVEVERDGRTEEQYFAHGLVLPREGAELPDHTDGTEVLRALGLIDASDD